MSAPPASASRPLTVTICGGGNGAHTAAGYIGTKAHIRVNVLTRRPQDWASEIRVVTAGSSWEHKGELVGRLHRVSSDPADVIPEADVVFVAAPANAHPHILRAIAPHVRPGQTVGALFAQGGFDWIAQSALGDRMGSLRAVFGLQNIPWICKAPVYGKQAKILGPKDTLWVAATPVERTAEVAATMGALFDIPCKTIPNFLCLTLTPSNQIIHPARYYGIFRDWDGKRTYKMEELRARNGLTLYADMDEFSAEELAKLDNELQQVKCGLVARFPALDLSRVMPIGERIVDQYGADVADRSSLRRIFATNRGYAGCGTPLKEVAPGQYHPATESRLFWEDIPFGLCILKSMACMLGIPTPSIDFYIRWHQQFMGKQFLLPNGTLNAALIPETGAPEAYGISSLEALVRFALPETARKALQSRL